MSDLRRLLEDLAGELPDHDDRGPWIRARAARHRNRNRRRVIAAVAASVIVVVAGLTAGVRAGLLTGSAHHPVAPVTRVTRPETTLPAVPPDYLDSHDDCLQQLIGKSGASEPPLPAAARPLDLGPGSLPRFQGYQLRLGRIQCFLVLRHGKFATAGQLYGYGDSVFSASNIVGGNRTVPAGDFIVMIDVPAATSTVIFSAANQPSVVLNPTPVTAPGRRFLIYAWHIAPPPDGGTMPAIPFRMLAYDRNDNLIGETDLSTAAISPGNTVIGPGSGSTLQVRG